MTFSSIFPVFILIGVIFIGSCENDDVKEENQYAEMTLKKADFDSNDINFLLTSQTSKLVSESKLNKRIDWNAMKLIDSIYLETKKDTLYVYKAKVKKETIIVYQTTDSVNLLIYFSGINLHSETISILRNKMYEKTLDLLVKNEDFIINRITEKFPNPNSK